MALKLGQCLRTNRSHCALLATFFGNKCIEMPSVYVVFLQRTKSGHPATQHFPLFRFFCSVAMMARRFYTTYDVVCPNLHILTVRGMSHTFGSNWPTSRQEKKLMRPCPMPRFENYESVQYRLQLSGIKRGRKFHFVGTLMKLVYKNANVCLVTLRMIIPFTKTQLNIETIKNFLKLNQLPSRTMSISKCKLL